MGNNSSKNGQDKRISRRMFDILIGEEREITRQLVGKLLTVTDSITTDAVQRKAMKNLVEDAIYTIMSRMDRAIRIYSQYLAEAINEKCDWNDVAQEGRIPNPLTD